MRRGIAFDFSSGFETVNLLHQLCDVRCRANDEDKAKIVVPVSTDIAAYRDTRKYECKSLLTETYSPKVSSLDTQLLLRVYISLAGT